MLGVCFFVNEPRDADKDRPKFYDWTAVQRGFEVDRMLYVNPYEPQDPNWPSLEHFNSLEDAIASTDVSWIFLEYNEDGSTSLPDFKHPEDVVYCFGSDRKGLDHVDKNLGEWVSLPTESSLYANQTAAVVLSHRKFLKKKKWF